MTAPHRIQLRRTKGWRKPEGAVNVARPSRWGNPFKPSHDILDARSIGGGRREFITTREDVVQKYRDMVDGRLQHPWGETYRPTREKIRAELAGRDLCCWCKPDQACHADVLLEIANGDGRG